MIYLAAFVQKRTVWLTLSFGLAGIIAVLTLIPQVEMPAVPRGIDKLYHVAAFAALVFPTALLRPERWRSAGCLAILYGGIIEAIQPVFGRSADMSDSWADVLGVATGIFLGLAVRRIFLSVDLPFAIASVIGEPSEAPAVRKPVHSIRRITNQRPQISSMISLVF